MKHKELIRDSRFRVVIDNKSYSFQKVEGIVNQFSKEMYNEGGVDEPHFFEASQLEVNTLVLERALLTTKDSLNFSNKVQPGISLSNVEIIVLDKKNKPCREFFIPTAVVTKYSVSNFDAMGEGVLTESIELSYYKMSQMEVK